MGNLHVNLMDGELRFRDFCHDIIATFNATKAQDVALFRQRHNEVTSNPRDFSVNIVLKDDSQ